MNKKLKYPLIILFALFLSVGSASSQSKMDWYHPGGGAYNKKWD